MTEELDKWVALVRDLCPPDVNMACDECGGDAEQCPSQCAYRRAAAMLNEIDAKEPQDGGQ